MIVSNSLQSSLLPATKWVLWNHPNCQKILFGSSVDAGGRIVYLLLLLHFRSLRNQNRWTECSEMALEAYYECAHHHIITLSMDHACT
jgi:hypothetical protein